MPKPKIDELKITDLRQDPSNANKGSERGLRVLDDSIAETGLGRSVVTDKNGILIAGNKTTERAVDSGFEDAIVVHSDGKRLVVVQRDDLDLLSDNPNNPARKMAYYDNRAATLMAWDAAQIAADVEAGVDLSGMFTPLELDMIAGHALDENDPAALWNGMPEFEQKDLEAFRTLKIHFSCQDDIDSFARLIEQTITNQTVSFWFPKILNENLKQHRVIDES